MGIVLILIRNVWGYAYSNDIEVVDYVAVMLPVVATSNFLDGLQCVLSGSALCHNLLALRALFFRTYA